MVRTRIPPGEHGPISTALMGTAAATGKERAMPKPQAATYPRTWKLGETVTVQGQRYILSRWRGICTLADPDPTAKTTYQIRRYAQSKSGAEHACKKAALNKIIELEHCRQQASAKLEDGDTVTTVGDLLNQVPSIPSVKRMAARTRENYLYAIPVIAAHQTQPGDKESWEPFVLSKLLPRHVDVATVKRFLASYAAVHGSSSARVARAILNKALSLAVEDSALRTPHNPVALAHAIIPQAKIQRSERDPGWVPSPKQLRVFFDALQTDPRAQPHLTKRAQGTWYGPRESGKDLVDLLRLLFSSGLRLGEALALRWSDLHLVEDAGTIAVTGTVQRQQGVGIVRKGTPKTRRSARTIPISNGLVDILKARIAVLGVTEQASNCPVFPQPGRLRRFRSAPQTLANAWRDPGNLTKTLRKTFDTHGWTKATAHTARHYVLTRLAEQGVPLHRVADFAGHEDATVTIRYFGRSRKADDAVRKAL